MDPSGTQKGSVPEPPSGEVIPRIERQTAHEEFTAANPYVDTVMLPITHAERLLSEGVTASAYTDKDLITTTTIRDTKLKRWNWRRELDVVSGFGPTYHIPTDYWVYGDMDKEDRLTNIKALMNGTEWMARVLSDSPIRLIPLVKGYSLEERQICYQVLDRLGIGYVGFYGAQYFGEGHGNGINALDQDLRDIASEYSPDGMLLIGMQSENYIDRLPPEVDAVAGQRWIEKSKLRETEKSHAVEYYNTWKQDLEEGLNSGPATLGMFSNRTEVTA